MRGAWRECPQCPEGWSQTGVITVHKPEGDQTCRLCQRCNQQEGGSNTCCPQPDCNCHADCGQCKKCTNEGICVEDEDCVKRGAINVTYRQLTIKVTYPSASTASGGESGGSGGSGSYGSYGSEEGGGSGTASADPVYECVTDRYTSQPVTGDGQYLRVGPELGTVRDFYGVEADCPGEQAGTEGVQARVDYVEFQGQGKAGLRTLAINSRNSKRLGACGAQYGNGITSSSTTRLLTVLLLTGRRSTRSLLRAPASRTSTNGG